MMREEVIEYVDRICEEQGYTDSPAYDLIYNECCLGRSDKDAKEMIRELLISYNA